MKTTYDSKKYYLNMLVVTKKNSEFIGNYNNYLVP